MSSWGKGQRLSWCPSLGPRENAEHMANPDEACEMHSGWTRCPPVYCNWHHYQGGHCLAKLQMCKRVHISWIISLASEQVHSRSVLFIYQQNYIFAVKHFIIIIIMVCSHGSAEWRGGGSAHILGGPLCSVWWCWMCLLPTRTAWGLPVRKSNSQLHSDVLSPSWTSLWMSCWGMIVLNAELKSMNSNLTYVSFLSRCVRAGWRAVAIWRKKGDLSLQELSNKCNKWAMCYVWYSCSRSIFFKPGPTG